MKTVFLLPSIAVSLLGLIACSKCPAPEAASSIDAEPHSLAELSPEQLRVWLRGHPGDWRSDTDQARGLPEPSAIKAIPDDALRIDLGEPNLAQGEQRGLAELIAHRRSRRDYSEAPLTLDDLGFLLWSAQGISAADLDEQGGVQQLYRTAPSAGGRHPLETYLFVQRVEGLQPGLYRYLSAEHQLILLKEGSHHEELQTACYGSSALSQAAALLVWTAVPYRTEWKYGTIAHRMIAMEAGHACQNLYLAGEALELGVCAMSAYDQKRMDALLGVDGQDEFAMYMATVGHRTITQ